MTKYRKEITRISFCSFASFSYTAPELQIPTQMITKKEVQHIAKLAKLHLTDAEVEKFTGQLGSILDFFAQLQEVKTDHTEETSQVTGLENVTRLDQVNVYTEEDSLLDCSPHKIENHSIKVPKIF